MTSFWAELLSSEEEESGELEEVSTDEDVLEDEELVVVEDVVEGLQLAKARVATRARNA